jgi:hypothetical protein
MKPDKKNYFIFSALLPVSEDGPLAPPTLHLVTTLASDLGQAQELTSAAGLTLLGQLDEDGKLLEP